jgi:hypothetical protein
VNAWTLRRLLDRPDCGSPKTESLLEEIPDEQMPELYRFCGEIGRRFEAALSSGALEEALCLDIDRLKGELDRYLSERGERLATQDGSIASRWHSTISPKPRDIEGHGA